MSFKRKKSVQHSSKINWEKAITSGAITVFRNAVDTEISPLLNKSYDNCTKINSEINLVCESVCRLADDILPKFNTQKKPNRNYFKDEQLNQLCKDSKAAWRRWRDSGRPQSGVLFTEKITCKKKVQSRLNLLKAKKERLHSAQIDKQFREKARNRFKPPRSGCATSSRLEVNGNIIEDECEVLSAWAKHFEDLGASRIEHTSQLHDTTASLFASSFDKEDYNC